MTSPLARRQVSDTQKVLFHPYTRQQMASILRQQVERLPGPVFEPMALTLCAAKVR
jgi:Cdc6-like AAA superfamily ATPase